MFDTFAGPISSPTKSFVDKSFEDDSGNDFISPPGTEAFLVLGGDPLFDSSFEQIFVQI